MTKAEQVFEKLSEINSKKPSKTKKTLGAVVGGAVGGGAIALTSKNPASRAAGAIIGSAIGYKTPRKAATLGL